MTKTNIVLVILLAGCGTVVRSCNSYQVGVDQGPYWDACFTPSPAQDEEEYNMIINSMTWGR